jgi:hypothetical protein
LKNTEFVLPWIAHYPKVKSSLCLVIPPRCS